MFRFNTVTLCLIGTIVVLAGIVLYLYSGRKENMGPTEGHADGDVPRPSPRPTAMDTPAEVASDNPILVLFKAEWCHHCKSLAPGWVEVEKALAGKHQVRQIDSADPELANHQIKGFPTIRYFPKGLKAADIFVDYKGERTPQGILTFLQNPK